MQTNNTVLLLSYAVVVGVMDALGKMPLVSVTVPLVIASRRTARAQLVDVEGDMRQWQAGNLPEISSTIKNAAKNEQRRHMTEDGVADSEDFGQQGQPSRNSLDRFSGEEPSDIHLDVVTEEAKDDEEKWGGGW
jgi:hypothetical protein